MAAERRHLIRNRILKILLGLVILLVIVRLLIPVAALKVINSKLDHLEGYHGKVKDLDLYVIRGKLDLNHVFLDKIDGDDEEPFITVKRIATSISWMQLFKGKISCSILVREPKINFVVQKEKKLPKQVSSHIDSDWRDQVTQLIPIRVNTLEVQKGEIHFKDLNKTPPVEISLHHFELAVMNIANREKTYHDGLASLALDTDMTGKGHVEATAVFDPLIKPPKFDLKSEVKIKDLPAFNNVFKSYGNFDVKKGEFEVYSELTAADGKFKGYLKPLFKDLDLLNWKKDSHKGFSHLLWQALLETGVVILENPKEDQIATKIPFSGSLKNPKADIGDTIAYLIENGFVRALIPGFERGPVMKLNPKSP